MKKNMTVMKRFGNSLWLALFILFTSVITFSTTYGGSKMERIYSIGDANVIEPQVYDVGKSSSLSLFPVPQDNSIGTNDLSNAITLLSFHKSRVTYDKLFKNAVHDVEGSGEYLPIVSQDIIGFGQTRRFLLYDFRYKICQDYRIVGSLGKTIEKIAIADAKRRHFIFEIQAHNGHSEDPWDYTTRLLLMDLSDKEAQLIKEIKIGNGVTWSVEFDRIFLYHIGEERLQVLTTNFESSHHPLSDIIKQNKKKVSFTRIQPHSNLPFAVLYGGDEGSTLISWAPGKTPQLLFSGATQFSFSPDGKWLAFKKGGVIGIAKTYLMPVSEKYPNYLGSPILLLNNYFNKNNFGWTTNPISFVGSSLNELYRWELTNAAHPESDKATFHDYIVERDLEKLTREKRQGLGNVLR